MVKWINYIDLNVSFEAIQKKLNVKLPSDLKEIIKSYNKGMPTPNKFFLENGKFTEIFQLLSFNFDEKLTAYSCMTPEMKERQIIPFAITKNNNFVCLKDSNVILYNIDYGAEKLICNSVSELIDNLK